MSMERDFADNNILRNILPVEDIASDVGYLRDGLTTIELHLAYASENVLNLEMLLMLVISKASDYETLAKGSREMPNELIENAFELDILSGILDLQVKELDCFISCLSKEILDARVQVRHSELFSMSCEEMGQKLHEAEESLKQLNDRISEIKKQIEKVRNAVPFAEQETSYENSATCCLGNCYFSSYGGKWKIKTVEPQRHTLRMLEKSLDRELELEKKLADARKKEEEIKLKLHYAEQETYFMEEAVHTLLERLFEAENAAVVLTGISKELAAKLQIVQFNLNRSLSRESEMKDKLERSMLKSSDAETAIKNLNLSGFNLNIIVQQENDLKDALKVAQEKCDIAKSEAVSLREKVNSLEEQLRASSFLLQEAEASYEASLEQQNILNAELLNMENIILDLRDNMFKSESRAENAEGKCILLAETNLELNEELGYIKSSGTEKSKSLELKLEASDAQLEEAKASVEAIEEQQTMLYSTLNDMQNVIEDLKIKVSKAEKRAENAELKCTLLTEINLELNEEVGFLKGKVESLKKDLHQMDTEKIATANDIDIKTKIISGLVMKLAREREHLQMQISAMKKENKKTMANKCGRTNDFGHDDCNGSGNDFAFLKISDEAVIKSSTSNFKIQTKRISNLDSERLSKLVFIKYNKALYERFQKRRLQNKNEDYDPIVLDDLNYSSEWMTGRIGACNEFVYEEGRLTWAEVQSPVAAVAADETKTVPTTSVEDVTALEFKLVPIRLIEASKFNVKHLALAFVIMLIAVGGVYVFQIETCPL